MRIPASRLLEHLQPGCCFSLRSADYSGADNSLPYTEAVALVVRGEIEGVASPSGRIKYLRMLAESEREQPAEQPSPQQRECSSRSTAIANTRMGVYREEVESSVMDEWGMPTRIVIGHIWQHYGVSL